MTSKEVKRPLNGTLAVSLGLVRFITLFRKLKMPRKSKKKKSKKQDLMIYQEPDRKGKLSPYQEFGYRQEKQKRKK